MISSCTLEPKEIDSYLDRLKLSSDLKNDTRLGSPDMHLLKDLVRSHQRSIPFENLSLVHPKAREQDGARIRIDLPSVFDKLVTRRRGGYCFEQNSLMAAVLRALDYELYTSAARVLPGEESSQPGGVVVNGLDHQITMVSLAGTWWVVDVGFGSKVPLEPVPLDPQCGGDGESCHDGKPRGSSIAQHRVRRGVLGSSQPPPRQPRQPHREGWYMQTWSNSSGEWQDLYFFQEIEFAQNDYAIANWFTSTHPDMFFTKELVAAIQTPSGRITLSDHTLRVFERRSPEDPVTLMEETELSSDVERDAALQQYFGIAF